MSDTTDDGFSINGKLYTVEDLTFREQRELRAVIREHLAEDPTADIDDMAVMDVVPAFVYIVLKRDTPDLELETVLDMKLTDFVLAEPNGNGSGKGKAARPTKASATSGPRK